MKHFLLILVSLVLTLKLSAQILPAAQHSDTTTYNFDYQLLPNTHYVFNFISDSRIESKTEGEIDKAEYDQIPGLLESLNSTKTVKHGETQTLITTDQVGQKISFTASVDSTISDMNHPILENIPGFNMDDIESAIKSRKAYGHTLDHKKLMTDTITGQKIKYLGPNYFGYSAWSTQMQLPEGTMMVGDTFNFISPVRIPKKKKSITLTPERIEKMDSTQLKQYREMARLREGLNKSTSQSSTYYVLKSVEGDVAYFMIETYSKSTIPDLMETQSSGNGELEYNFKYKCFTNYVLNNSSSIKTTEDSLVSYNDSSSTISRTIQIKE